MKADDELVSSESKMVLDGFHVPKGKGIAPMAPTRRTVEDVLHAAIVYTAVASETMPCWLPATFDQAGRAMWGSRITFDAPKIDGPIRPEAVIAFPNGLLDVDAWIRGEIRLIPPTPRWFNRSCCPVPLPVDLLRAIDEGEARGENTLAETMMKLCPRWVSFLGEVFPEDAGVDDGPTCGDVLHRWFGYCLTSDISLQKIMWIQGAPGGGKGTIVHVLTSLLGEDNVCNTDLDSIAGRFDLASMVGRRVAFMPEMRIGRQTNSAQALNRVLSISGGDRQGVEDKFTKKEASVRLSIKLMVTPNEEPSLRDNSAALIRRLVVLPTGEPPQRPDPDLQSKLEKEVLGVLIAALYALRQMRRDVQAGLRAFPQPECGQMVLDEIERGSSEIKSFIFDRCVLQADSKVDAPVLLAHWKQYAKGIGYEDHLTPVAFGRALAAAGKGKIVRVRKGSQSRGGMSHYTGVRLLREGEDPHAPGPASHDKDMPVVAYGDQNKMPW